MQKRVCLVVLGMHRSGTSALTRALSLMGAALPKEVIGAGAGNETGHWEPKKLADLHDRMLVEAGSSWDDWRKFEPKALLSEERYTQIKAEICDVIEEDYADAPLFVLKDPRLCRFVPMYREIMAHMNIDMRPVIAFRHPNAVAGSLQERDKIAFEEARLYWLRHVLDAEASTRDQPRVTIAYENMLTDWRAQIALITSRLGIVWPRSIEDAAPDIEAYISRTHQHHGAAARGQAGAPELTRWISRAHAALTRLNTAPSAAIKDLDAIAAPFESTALLVSALSEAERQRTERIVVKLKNDVERLKRSRLKSRWNSFRRELAEKMFGKSEAPYPNA